MSAPLPAVIGPKGLLGSSVVPPAVDSEVVHRGGNLPTLKGIAPRRSPKAPAPSGRPHSTLSPQLRLCRLPTAHSNPSSCFPGVLERFRARKQCHRLPRTPRALRLAACEAGGRRLPHLPSSHAYGVHLRHWAPPSGAVLPPPSPDESNTMVVPPEIVPGHWDTPGLLSDGRSKPKGRQMPR